MTFNVDPVSAALLALGIAGGYRAWDSIQKQIERKHNDAIAAFEKYADGHEQVHRDIRDTLEDHSDRIGEIRREVDGHGYRLTAVEGRK